MGKLVLAFASFWVRICLKVCKSTETEELWKLIELLENRTIQLESNEKVVTTSAKRINRAAISAKAIKRYLDNKSRSQSPDDWMEIARCDIATEEQLMRIAKGCINLYYYYSDSKSMAKQLEIAKALYENPNVTANVMAELRTSSYITVVAVGHQWIEQYLKKQEAKNDENAMFKMMQYLDNQALSREPDNWISVAKCDFATETHLVQVAEKCVGLDDKQSIERQVEIAKALEKNPQTTEAVMEKLTESQCKEVKEIGIYWLKEHME